MIKALNIKNNTLGFTIVEALVSTAIFVFALSLMYSSLFSGMDTWEIGSIKADIQERGQIALRNMINELRQATNTSSQTPSPNVVIPASPNNTQITFYLPADIDGDGLLTDTSGDIEWDITNPIQFQFISAQNRLVRIEGVTQKVLALNVEGIEFYDITIDPTLALQEVRINMTLTEPTPKGRDISIALSSIAGLRN